MYACMCIYIYIYTCIYDKTYLDNKFSLKADVSQLTGSVKYDYLELTYTNCD